MTRQNFEKATKSRFYGEGGKGGGMALIKGDESGWEKEKEKLE